MFDPVTEFRYYDRPTRAPLSQPNSRSIPGIPSGESNIVEIRQMSLRAGRKRWHAN